MRFVRGEPESCRARARRADLGRDIINVCNHYGAFVADVSLDQRVRSGVLARGDGPVIEMRIGTDRTLLHQHRKG